MAANKEEAGVTLAAAVEERIRADILSARLKPSARLRFQELGSTYNASMGTLREALCRLNADNLVEMEGNRGYWVASVAPEELLEIIDAQKSLEVLALRRAIESGDDEWEAQIVAAYHRMIRIEKRSAQYASPKLDDEWEQLHHRFHEALIAGCDSRWFLRFCRLLREQSTRYRRWADVPHWQYETLTIHHEPLMNAALDRDGETACGLLTVHFDEVTRIVLDKLDCKAAVR